MTTPFVKAEPTLGSIAVHIDKVTAGYLAVGADDHVLIASSIEPLGLKFGPAPTVGGGFTTTVDFGAFPGSTDANAVVAGYAAFVAATSIVNVWIHCIDSADNDWRDHREAVFAGLTVVATEFVDGDGFTIYAHSATPLVGLINVAGVWQ